MEKIYLDNASTTPMNDKVIETIYNVMKYHFGNASSIHSFGRDAKKILTDSRHIIANSINADDSEIIFTSGGTESNNTAIIQAAMSRMKQGKHIITTCIEHESVLESMKYLENNGFEVTYLPVNSYGEINLSDLKSSLKKDTILVSIMTCNNEIGTIMPIHDIGQIVLKSNALFHTDAVQAYGLMDIDVKRDNIDLLSTSSHKLNGPKFLGFLYKNSNILFDPYIKGGNQELMRRAGTENIPGISGFAKAVELNNSVSKSQKINKYMNFKNMIIKSLIANNIDFEINGRENINVLPHIMNIWFKGIPNNILITNLDLENIAVSAGSACTAGSLKPSHVLQAIYGKDDPRIYESIRLSFGAYNTTEEINIFLNKLIKIVKRLRVK